MSISLRDHGACHSFIINRCKMWQNVTFYMCTFLRCLLKFYVKYNELNKGTCYMYQLCEALASLRHACPGATWNFSKVIGLPQTGMGHKGPLNEGLGALGL